MCSHFEAVKSPKTYKQAFNVEPPAALVRTNIWPGYESAFIRRPKEADSGDEAVPEREALAGQFGLLPHWAKDEKFGRRTFNSRSETAATLPSFRDAWKWGRRCIIPAAAIYEPDWRSGKAVATRIERADGAPMGIAGLWSSWKGPEGEVLSFTMLTINADKHELMKNFHKPADEKRMVVVLPDSAYDAWLNAKPEHSMDFMRTFPHDQLVAGPSAK